MSARKVISADTNPVDANSLDRDSADFNPFGRNSANTRSLGDDSADTNRCVARNERTTYPR